MDQSGSWQDGEAFATYQRDSTSVLARVGFGRKAITASARVLQGKVKITDVYSAVAPRSVGFGTLAVNTLLQVLKRDFPAETQVYGDVVPLGAETQSAAAISEGGQRRVSFWSNFGFRVTVDSGFRGRIEGHLGDLRLYDPDRPPRGELPRLVSLDAFISEASR